MKKILCLLTVSILSIDPSFSMQTAEIQELTDDKIKVKYYFSDYKIYTESLKNYSAPISEDLKPVVQKKYDTTPIRVITAESILNGIKKKRPDVNIEHSRGLLKRDNAEEIRKEYVKFADKSYFVEFENKYIIDGAKDFKLLGDGTKQEAKNHFMQLLDITLLSHIGRQSLVTFLAAHKTALPNQGMVIAYSKKDEEPSIAYPVINVHSGYSANFYGLPADISEQKSYEVYTIGKDAFLQHELNHATHRILGIQPMDLFCYDAFLYQKELFLKELLFSGFDTINNRVKQSLENLTASLDDEGTQRFNATFQGCLSSIMNPVKNHEPYKQSMINLLDIKFENKTQYIYSLSYRLSSIAISLLWNNSPEEMSNVIGVIYDEGTLYINTLSDMDTSLELQRNIRFPYFSRRGFDEVNFSKFGIDGNVSSIFTSLLNLTVQENLPTRESWEMLVKLHQGVHNLGTEN